MMYDARVWAPPLRYINRYDARVWAPPLKEVRELAQRSMC